MSSIKLLFVIFVSFISTNLSGIQLKGKCGFPGRPYRANLEQNNKVVPIDKIEFDEGEEVTVVCKDYWPPRQKRKCVRGEWSGEPPRCADFMFGFQMKDSKVENISNPNNTTLMFEHLDMKFETGGSANLNVFTTMQFKKARLRVYDSSKYKWSFNFTAPSVKLFVRVNFIFVNYTILPRELQNNFTFNISINVSPYRNCELRLKKAYKDNLWAKNGLKMECHFICDSVSPEGWERDLQNPGNYLIMETQTSIDIPHDIVTIYFGRSYNTEDDPLCGEPEFSFGQTSNTKIENIVYVLNCNTDEFEYFSQTNNSNSEPATNELKCSADMKWSGTYPSCVPTNPCSIDGLTQNNETVIISFDGLFFLNVTNYYAINGTQVKYGCSHLGHIFMNENSTTSSCQETGLWNEPQPQCYNPTKPTNSSVWILIGILLIIVILIVCLTGVLFNVYTKRIRNRIKEQYDLHNMDENYDDILSDKTFDDDISPKYDNTYYTIQQEYEEIPSTNVYSGIPNQQTSQYLVMTCVTPSPGQISS